MNVDEIEILLHGRRPNSRKLTWHEIREELARTTKKTPEVVIKVRGGGLTPANVKRYMKYISRNGKLPTRDEKNQNISGKDQINDLQDSWDLDMMKGQGKLHQTFNVVLSMPAKTDPKKLLAAVQHFARDNLGQHQYVMAVHTRETDPRQPAPEHPHVHLIIKAEDMDGKRLHIRKDTLRTWRESFAGKLRDQGIEANATSRNIRGVSFKNKKSGEYRASGRGQSTALAKRFEQAKLDLEHGNMADKPWERAMAARRRDVTRGMAAAAELLRQEGNTELASAVEQYAGNLPALDTEQRQMQRAIVAEVEKRLEKEPKKTRSGKSR